jgi:hypothetical protein
MLPTEPGDVVAFDVRLTHRGRVSSPIEKVISVAARAVPSARRGAVVASVRQRVNRFRRRPARLAVFVAYGIANDRTATFASRNLARQRAQIGHEDPAVFDAAVRDFEALGLPTVSIGVG